MADVLDVPVVDEVAHDSGEGLTADEVVTIVEGASNALADSFSASDAQLSADVVSLGEDVRALSKSVSSLSASPDDGATYVVMLSDEQWDTVRDCWLWVKSGVAVGLFLMLVCTLLVATVLGTRLWSDFSRGWRRG